MTGKTRTPIRSPYLLEVTTYLTVAAMGLLGISGLDDVTRQVIGLGLCLIFGLLHAFVYQSGRYGTRPGLYFGAQAVVMFLLLRLGSRNTDAFNFLFIFLSIHAAAVLPIRTAAVWAAVYFSLISGQTLIDRGLNGLYAALFYLVTYVAAGAFGYALQQAELARRRIQQLLEELQVAQQRVRELAVVEERNRLARDLHDSVKQQVFAISMQLGAARALLRESDPAFSHVNEAERLAKQAGGELTHLIRELRPPGLAGKSLAAALQYHVRDWSRQTGISADLDAEEVQAAPAQVEQALFRVAQEALANVARHSGAGRVKVRLFTSDGELSLSVEDDGQGFDMAQAAQGVGLDSMRERLAGVGGTLEVSRREPNGTRVRAWVRRN